MAEGAVDRGLSAQDWMLDQIAGEEPALVVRAARTTRGDLGFDRSANPVDDHEDPETLNAPLEQTDPDSSQHRLRDVDPAADDATGTSAADPDAGAKRAAVWLGCAALLTAIGIVMASAVFGAGAHPVTPPVHRVSSAAVTAAPTAANPAVAHQDQAVPFTAQTDSCTPAGGSAEQSAARSPQALSDTGTDSAWVCGRGPQESLLDGQILHVGFICDATRPLSVCSYMLNAVSVTPGWVAKTAAGTDEWLGHRVVRRLQFNFFDGNQLAADPLFVDTHSVHGPVTTALPGKVLASRVEVIILHTERPPAAASDAPAPGHEPDAVAGAGADPGAGPAAGDSAAPPPAEANVGSDAVDATFAMSQLQFLGHAPD